MILKTLNIKDHISEIISISNLQFTSHFIENTHIINYIPKPKIYNIGLLNSFLIGLVIGKLWLYFNKSSIAKFIINNVNIYILKYISRRILNISLFWKLFVFLLCVFSMKWEVNCKLLIEIISEIWSLIFNVFKINS